MTDGFLRSVATESGVNSGEALAFANTAAAQKPLERATADAAALGINATPTFTVDRGDGAPKVVTAAELGAELAR